MHVHVHPSYFWTGSAGILFFAQNTNDADEIAVANVQALNTLLDELLQSGLLVESTS